MLKDKVWLALNEKGKKINHEAQLEQTKLLIELNAQEISTYTNYFIAFLTVVVTALTFLYSLRLTFEVYAIFIAIIIAGVGYLVKKISRIYRNNELLVEVYCGIQAKRGGYRIALIEGDIKEIRKMLKSSLEKFKGKVEPSEETLKMLDSED